MGAGLRLDHPRVVEERRRGDDLGELPRELAEHQVLGATFDEADGGGVPEEGAAAVAEQHLVAVGEREQLGEPGADRPDHVAHRGLAMARAEQGRAGVGDGLRRFRAHLRRPGSEASVARKQVAGMVMVVGSTPASLTRRAYRRPPRRPGTQYPGRLGAQYCVRIRELASADPPMTGFLDAGCDARRRFGRVTREFPYCRERRGTLVRLIRDVSSEVCGGRR